MPIRRRYAKKRPAKRGRGKRPGKRLTTQGRQPNHAVCTETKALVDMPFNTEFSETFSLSQFPRALNLSKLYRFFRPKICEFRYLPTYNMFGESNSNASVSAPTVPQMIWQMNRTQDSTTLSLTQLEAEGGTRRPFKTMLKIKYKPNLVQSIMQWQSTGSYPGTNGCIGTTPLFNRWQSSAASPVLIPNVGTGAVQNYSDSTVALYNGHSIYCYQLTAGISAYACQRYVVVTWEFKDPVYELAIATPDPSGNLLTT